MTLSQPTDSGNTPPRIVVELPGEAPSVFARVDDAIQLARRLWMTEDDRKKAHHQAALRFGLAMVQLKDKTPHGEWLPFLARAGLNARTTAKWMRLAREEAML